MSINSGTKLSLVVPVYYEEECINEFIRQTVSVLNRLNITYEIIFVDDGSTDKTVELIKQHILGKPQIRLIELSYNHGKQAALTAGLFHAMGDYILMMDPDLQDPPEEIVRFLQKIEEGYDLVFGVRSTRHDRLINKFFSLLFWKSLEIFTGLNLPSGLAVIRIMSRRFVEQFKSYPERNRFLEGMFVNVGMKRTQITVAHHPRFAGQSKFTFSKKIKLATDAILDFSDLPLKITFRFGVFLTCLGFLSGVLLVVSRLFLFEFQIGWASVVVILTGGFGLVIFFLGIIGSYVGRIYTESKKRPLYSIKEKSNF